MKGVIGGFPCQLARVQSRLLVQMATGATEEKTLRSERRKKT